MSRRGRYEVHEHCWVSGPRRGRVVHSHEGGDVPHRHLGTGPSSYTIDKDEWFARTGLRGGGRKKFTASPTGEQFPQTNLSDEERSFDVIVAGPPSPGAATGPGAALPERLIQGLGMRVRAVRGSGEAA